MLPSDLNWQMTGFFLLALALLGFVMKLVALLLPVTARSDRAGIFWLLLSPNALRRLRPAVEPWRALCQTLLWFGAVLLSYQIYWWLIGGVPIGLLRSYAALPVLVVMSEFLVSLATVVWLPGGQRLPPIHCRLWLTRGLADFWGRRWNLWFSDWFRYAMLSRLRRWPVFALILIFAVSGVMHEWVINVPLYYLTGRAWFGSMMIYFLLQAAGILLERQFLKRRGALKVGFAWLVILAPAPLIMNDGLLRTLHLWPRQVPVALTALTIGEPDRVETVTVVSPTNAAFAEHLAQLRVPEGFTVVVQPPFVVIGDESPAQVQLRATNTVKWAVDRLKLDYFPRDPAEIIDIWLFRDRTSYTNHARLLFNDTPTTPFGYYSAEHRALIMNIATGGGTLVHEIVHPFMRANFPECPAWFNEGLASLYEQASDRQGHIRGNVNWRFKGLEQSIKDGKTISFQRLTAMSELEFYGGSNSTNYNQHYGQTRYLCYYLQEKGLLKKFYREFLVNAKADPTGFNTLKGILGENDMAVFQKKWEKFVLELRKPQD